MKKVTRSRSHKRPNKLKNYTDITILLDRSGSMESIRTSMQDAFNEFISGHKVNPSTRVSLIQFNSSNDQQVVYQNVPVKYVEPLRINPNGGTPLLDALCKAIDNTGSRFAEMLEADRPNKVLFVIITDGQENMSQTYKRSDVKDRIQNQTGKYSWGFVYLGANQDAFAEAQSFGIPQAWTLNYAATDSGTKGMMRGLTTNTVNYASSNMSGAAASSLLNFDEEQRNEATGKTSSTTSSR